MTRGGASGGGRGGSGGSTGGRGGGSTGGRAGGTGGRSGGSGGRAGGSGGSGGSGGAGGRSGAGGSPPGRGRGGGFGDGRFATGESRSWGPPSSGRGGSGRSGGATGGGRAAPGRAGTGSSRSGAGDAGGRRGSGRSAAGAARLDDVAGRRPRSVGPPSIGGDQIEGRQAVREALRSKRRKLKELYVATSLEPTPALTEILRLAEDAMVSVRVVPKDRLERLARTEVHQGVVLRGEVLPMADVDDLLEAESSFLLALDGVTDPQNLGAILRSAEGAGVTGVLLPKHRAVHVTPAVAKAAAGAVEYVPIGLIPGVAALLDKARKAGIWIVGLDGAGTTDVFDAAPVGQRVMLVLGAEGTGLSRLVMERCDVLVRIPMAGRLGSLNVSAAAALACFEIGRRRH